ncbi:MULTISPECIES: FtsX-like permease family protein [Streptacidiphilus]|uniref:FtsX-like permease family protein n=1 Tax=Streptacidiphilus cavernicola TaxID=3342716 RepID=A0ABV6UR50_9ACTN|nr:FtsX-like permease family protein [Streptacidiphilus jeojiense]
MTFTALWLRLELRRRWRSLVVLALLVALAGTAVLASVAGARRGDTAVDRLVARTSPADITVLPNQHGFDWDRIRALPEVEALTTFVISSFQIEGVPDNSTGFAVADDANMRTIERPIVLQGRLADQARDDEVVVSAHFPGAFHKGVGDYLTIRLFTPAQVDTYVTGADPGAPAGPSIRARIVGVVRSPWYHDNVRDQGSVAVSAALYLNHRANFVGSTDQIYLNALVRLKGGEKTIPEFRADLARVSGRTDIDIWDNAELERHATRVNTFEGDCLLGFAGAALIAALFLVGQSVLRYTSATVADLQTLRGVGLGNRQALAAASAGPVIAALLGSLLGAAGAVLVSRWMPIGAAALYEPSPGFDVDWLVLGAGLVLTPLLALAGSVASAWLALASAQNRTAPRRSAVAVATARAGLPVPVVVGTRFALEPGRGRTAVPVRPALLGAVIGVLGVLAAFTFAAAVADAAANPARFGQTHQLESFLGLNSTDFGKVDPVLARIAADPAVTAVNNARIAVAESGDTSITTYTVDPVGGKPLSVVTVSGRLPQAADQIMLAPTSARALHAEVGSWVTLTGAARARREFTVTGIGFVPEGSHNDYDAGAWATTDGYRALFGTTFKFHLAEIALRPGSVTAAMTQRLQHEAAPLTGGQSIGLQQVTAPQQLAEIQDVQTLPLFLGGFLLLLAAGAVGHALATAVRRRRHDVAVLRALGMTRRQSRLVVVVQATVLALVGLVFGIPLGLALGRTLWRQVADSTPLAYHPPLALLTLLLAGPVALLLANLLAAWPGHRAARLHVGQTLRAE